MAKDLAKLPSVDRRKQNSKNPFQSFPGSLFPVSTTNTKSNTIQQGLWIHNLNRVIPKIHFLFSTQLDTPL